MVKIQSRLEFQLGLTGEQLEENTILIQQLTAFYGENSKDILVATNAVTKAFENQGLTLLQKHNNFAPSYE